MKTKYLQFFIISFVFFALTGCDNDIDYSDLEGRLSITDLEIETQADAANPRLITITAMAVNAGSYEVNFGDGSEPVVTTTGTAMHTYAEAGNYDITVKAMQDGLLFIQDSKSIGVAIIANLDFTTTINDESPTVVLLNATADNATSYTIDWGDSNSVTTETGKATHDYVTDGDYIITVTATADGFQSETIQKGVSISGGVELLVNFDFENGAEGWSNMPTLTEDPSCGSNSILLEGTENTVLAFEPVNGTIAIQWNYSMTNFNGTFSNFLVNQGVGDRIQVNVREDASYEFKVGATTVFRTGPNTMENNVCYAMKLEIDRESDEVRLFVDGLQIGEAGSATNVLPVENIRLVTFVAGDPIQKFYIDNVRVSRESGANPEILSQDFEDGLGSWTMMEGISIEEGCDGPGINVRGATNTQFDFDPIAGSVSIQYEFRTSNVNGTFSSFLVNAPPMGNEGRIQLNINNGQMEYKLGATEFIQLGPIENDTCYTMKIEVDRETNELRFFKDGIQEGENYDATGFGPEVFNFKLITFQDPGGADTPNFNVDNIKVLSL